jgi:hypothetical protein
MQNNGMESSQLQDLIAELKKAVSEKETDIIGLNATMNEKEKEFLI